MPIETSQLEVYKHITIYVFPLGIYIFDVMKKNIRKLAEANEYINVLDNLIIICLELILYFFSLIQIAMISSTDKERHIGGIEENPIKSLWNACKSNR